jgi:hypothetical protein
MTPGQPNSRITLDDDVAATKRAIATQQSPVLLVVPLLGGRRHYISSLLLTHARPERLALSSVAKAFILRFWRLGENNVSMAKSMQQLCVNALRRRATHKLCSAVTLSSRPAVWSWTKYSVGCPECASLVKCKRSLHLRLRRPLPGYMSVRNPISG